MKAIRSKIPDILKDRKLPRNEFIGECVKQGLSTDTANLLADGYVDFNTKTLLKVAKALGVSEVGDVMEFV